MSDDKTLGFYDLTLPVIMFHPNLHTARAFGPRNKPTGEPKFDAAFGFQPTHADLLPMKRVAAAVAKAKWAGRDLKTLTFPFANGTERADKAKQRNKDSEFERGLVIVAARSKFEPKLSAIVNGAIVEFDDPAARLASKPKFFFGAEVLAQFNFVAYEGVGNNPDGVTAYLQMVLATGKGTVIRAAGSSAAEVFKGYVGAVSGESVVGKTDEEIPF